MPYAYFLELELVLDPDLVLDLASHVGQGSQKLTADSQFKPALFLPRGDSLENDQLLRCRERIGYIVYRQPHPLAQGLPHCGPRVVAVRVEEEYPGELCVQVVDRGQQLAVLQLQVQERDVVHPLLENKQGLQPPQADLEQSLLNLFALLQNYQLLIFSLRWYL